METDHDNINQALETLPNGFARHQLVLDDQNNPADYIFLEVNAAFEEMTGLKRENILGRKVTEVLPGIEKDDFDWIGVYGKVATGGNSLNFEQYSEPLQRWYEVQIYSDEPGFFTTVFNEITARKEELASMKGLLELTEELFNTDLATFDYQSAADNLLKLSGAKFAAINTYEDDRTKTVTRAISGIPSMIESASKLLGFEIAGQAWEIIPERLRKIEGGKLVRFSSFYETAMGALNKTTSTALHKLTGIGDIYVLELAYGGRETTGDIIFFMPKGKGIHNREVIELYAGQLGAVLGRLRAEEKLLKNEKRLSMAQVNARAGYWEYDLKEERLYWSKECEALFGLEEKEFEGTFDAFLKRIHPEDKEYVLAMNQPITESKKGIPLEYEHRVIKKDGTVIWVRETADTVYEKTGEAAFVTGFVMDFTEQKNQAEQIARLAREQDILLNNIDAQVWYLTDVQTYGAVNEGHAAFFGVEVSDLAHKTLWERMPSEEEVKTCIDGNKQVFSDKKSIKTEEYVANGQGEKRLLAITKTPMLDQEDKVKHVVCSAVDITEQKEMEQELAHSEERFQKMLSLVPDMISIHDPDMNIVYSNWNGFGDVPEEKRILNTKCYYTYRGLDQVCPDCQAVEVLKTKKAIQKEVELPGGTWVDLRVMPVLGEHGSVELFVEWVRDITDRKQVEQEIIAQQKLLEGVMDNISDVLAIQDPDHRIERYNRSGYELLGMTVEEVKGKKCFELIGRDRECEECATRIAIQSGKMEQLEKYVPELGVYLDCRSNPIIDENGNVVRIVEQLRDITGQKEKEKQLRESEARLDALISQTPAVIYSYKLTGEMPQITYVNQNVKTLLGFEPEEFIDNFELFKECIHPEDAEGLFNSIPKLVEKGRITLDEYRFKDKQGNYHWLHDEQQLIVQDDGSMEVIGAWWDVTERKESEEALSERLAFEKMVSQVSAIFINQPPEEIDRGLNEALKVAGQFFGADRSYLYAFSEDSKTYSITHIWCAPGIKSNYEKDQNRQVRLQSCWAGELLKGNTVIINDVESMPPGQEEDKKDFLSEEIKSLLSIPLAGGGKVFGCFGLDHVNQKHLWAEDQVNLLQVVAELFAGALARHKNEETIRRLSFHDQLTGLYNRRYFENELERLDNSREHPVAVISADLDGLKLVNDTLGHSEGDRYLQAGADLLKNTLRESDILARVGGDEFALLLARTGKAEAEQVMNRIRRQVDSYNQEQKNLPLSISLGLAVSENPDYSLEEIFRMADNNMYTEKLEQSKKARAGIVSSLLASLFKRDSLEEGERVQVQELSIRLGLALKLEESRMADLELLTQVYDLGKVGLPDNLLHQSILENTGELTEAEREAIYRHPETGYRIAQASPDLAGVAELILRHHENYDGSGYPLGLKGEKVPVECRILAIAIAYSAMTHPRSYAEILSHEEALAELQRCAGSQFDPELVEVFTDMMSGEM